MSEVTLFKNSHGSVNVVLGHGGVIETVSFINGKFFTTNKALVAKLQAAVDNDNEFGIYIDVNESTIDPECATPMDQLKKKIREELMAELTSGGRLVDAGVSNQTLTSQAMSTTASIPGQQVTGTEQAKLNEQQAALISGQQTFVQVNAERGENQATAPAPAGAGSTQEVTSPTDAQRKDPTDQTVVVTEPVNEPVLTALQKLQLAKEGK